MSDVVAPWTPIERQLLESSVWEADPVVRVLWVSVLLIASEPGRNGAVDMTTRSLAARACLSIEETERALAVLTSPDPQSRSREEEGRRLVRIDPARPWGWRVVTWERRRRDRLRAMAALRKQRQRQRERVTERDTVTMGHADKIGEREENERGECEGGQAPPVTPRRARTASPSKGEPSLEAWKAHARETFRDWPDEDVTSAYSFAASEGWPRRGDWKERARRLHEAFRRRRRGSDRVTVDLT